MKIAFNMGGLSNIAGLIRLFFARATRAAGSPLSPLKWPLEMGIWSYSIAQDTHRLRRRW